MRGAHRAFFLDDDEKSRAVELLRRVEEFCGVMVLAYAIMSNHFHIFIYVPEPSALEDDEILRRRRRIRVWQCRGSMVWNSNAADLRSLSAS
jgi:REP element-mobilizing transposase RayT